MTRNATAAKINSHVCSARRPMACSAVLNKKLTIEPISPGSAEAAFAPSVLRPFVNCLPMAFKALVIVLTTAPIVMPAARKIDGTVTPYSFKISLILSRRGMAASLSAIWVCSLASSSVLSATLASAASLSEGVVILSWMIAWSSSFWRLSSLSRSFSSSRSFVLFSLSSISFLFFLFGRALRCLCQLFLSLYLCFLLVFQGRSVLFSYFQFRFDNFFSVA